MVTVSRILIILCAITLVVIGLLSAIIPMVCAWGFTTCLHLWRYFDDDDEEN